MGERGSRRDYYQKHYHQYFIFRGNRKTQKNLVVCEWGMFITDKALSHHSRKKKKKNNLKFINRSSS